MPERMYQPGVDDSFKPEGKKSPPSPLPGGVAPPQAGRALFSQVTAAATEGVGNLGEAQRGRAAAAKRHAALTLATPEAD